MDQSTLVSSGQALVKAMDADGFSPRLAMWVHGADADNWKLWLVPPAGHNDKVEFYRRVSQIANRYRQELGGISAGDTLMVLDSHPGVQGVGDYIRFPGLGSVSFPGNSFPGYYMPDGVILRSDL